MHKLLLTGATALSCATGMYAQNANMHYFTPYSETKAIEFTKNDNFGYGYVMTGIVRPWDFCDYKSISNDGLPLKRLPFHAVDEKLNTQIYKTYYSEIEKKIMEETGCFMWSMNMVGADIKPTKDGGYIICGNAWTEPDNLPCKGVPKFSYAFVLKTKSDGTPEWSQIYAKVFTFRSIAQEPKSGYYLVCGETPNADGDTDAAMIGIDDLGNVMWTHIAQPADYLNPDKLLSSKYYEVIPYNYQGKSLLALTGDAYETGTEVRDVLMTVVNIKGTHYADILLGGIEQGWKINSRGLVDDGSDKDYVTITGSWGKKDYKLGDMMTMISHVDPISQSIDFMRYYYDAGKPNGNIGRSISYDASNNYYDVTGYHYTRDGAIHLQTDAAGNWLRYVPHSTPLAQAGNSITFNDNLKYATYAGSYKDAFQSFAIANNMGYDCDENVDMKAPELKPKIYPVKYKKIEAANKDFGLQECKVKYEEDLACGSFKVGVTSVQQAKLVAGNLTLAPNPASNYADVQLSNHGTIKNIKVYDIAGRVVLSQAANANKVRINTENLAAGTYVLYAEDIKGDKEHIKFVKE